VDDGLSTPTLRGDVVMCFAPAIFARIQLVFTVGFHIIFLPICIGLAIYAQVLVNANASEIEIAAAVITEKTLACHSADDFMQLIEHLRSNNLQALMNDKAIYTSIGKCIDFENAQSVFIESEPRGDLLCVRPVDKSICYWAFSSNVMPLAPRPQPEEMR
jgi:hypothetical protein